MAKPTESFARAQLESDEGKIRPRPRVFPASGSRNPDAADVPWILVVDDELAIVQVIQLILESGGYGCAAATSGSAALALCRETKSRLGLLVTDLSMPGMDGAALIHTLRETDPGLPCIGMSGSDGGADSELWRGEEIVHVEKPFTAQKLLGAVSRLFPRTD